MEHIEKGIKERYDSGVFLKQGYNYCWICKKCNIKKYWFTDKNGYSLGPCKECLCKEIGYDIIKAIPYLDLFDLPYIPEQWNQYTIKAQENNIISPFGYYLSYCKLRTIKAYHFTDIIIYSNYNIEKIEYKKFYNEFIKYINNKFNENKKEN